MHTKSFAWVCYYLTQIKRQIVVILFSGMHLLKYMNFFVMRIPFAQNVNEAHL